VQVPVTVAQRRVADPGRAEDCELVVAIGGDGTALAAMRTAATAGRPVLGVACGSLGVLTTIETDRVAEALTRFCADDWNAVALPALIVEQNAARDRFALNDIAIVRAGQGQVQTAARVDQALIGRFAGDGCIVSTPLGSSAYGLAAGGPLLMPGTHAFVLTPLTVHGGFCPPIVLGPDAALELTVAISHGGARLEVDGQVEGAPAGAITLRLRQNVVSIVAFADQESFLEGLRRRKLIIDAPRVLAEDARQGTRH
jgi:NAD+ kinase